MSVATPLASFPDRREAAQLLDALSMGLLLLDSRLCVVYANVGARALLGLSLRPSRGVPVVELFAGAQLLLELVDARARALDARDRTALARRWQPAHDPAACA